MTHFSQLIEKLSAIYPWSERQRKAVLMAEGMKTAARVLWRAGYGISQQSPSPA